MACLQRLVFVVSFLLLPAVAIAQNVATGTISGVVRDSSGGVLPGVTVEVSSPALIERVRTAVTDGQGVYRVIDLRPGAYHGDVHALRLQHTASGGYRADDWIHSDR